MVEEFTIEIVTDLDQWSEMIIFESLLNRASFFWGSYGRNRLEPKTKPTLPSLTKLSLSKYVIRIVFLYCRKVLQKYWN